MPLARALMRCGCSAAPNEQTQIAACAEQAALVVDALTHIHNEDRGMRASHTCEHAALLCEARLATVRKAERIVRRVLAAKLLGNFKPLFLCKQVGRSEKLRPPCTGD